MTVGVESRVHRDDGFGRTSRFYDIDGKLYPSVTTILKVIAKPALVNWAARLERDMLVKAAADLYEDLPIAAPKMMRQVYEETLARRIGKEQAHAKALRKAGDTGTAVHALIEWNMRRELLQKVGPEPKVDPDGMRSFAAYEEWRQRANLAPVLVEQVVYSKRYAYAGTLDWAGELDEPNFAVCRYCEGIGMTDNHVTGAVECVVCKGTGRSRIFAVGDYKTGKGIYAESLLQNAALVHALVEMGHATPDDTGGCIVRLPKTGKPSEFQVRVIAAADQKKLFKVFLAVLELWRWIEEEEGR